MERWLESFARVGFLRSSDIAHDLKTPLNVAVLNLELLRMRVRKLTGDSDDEKLNEYARALETELRRMARIFDTFFLFSTPPKGEEAPGTVDASAIVADAAAEAGYEMTTDGAANVEAHEARIRQAIQLLLEGASKIVAPAGRRLTAERDGQRFHVAISGRPETPGIELSRLFKFYYTDSSGNPDVSLAAARLIAETYGGELNAVEESDKVSIRLSLPLR
jgi:signal transduction histidine kinase